MADCDDDVHEFVAAAAAGGVRTADDGDVDVTVDRSWTMMRQPKQLIAVLF